MRKKFILFLVEGINDKREIEAVLHTKYFSDYLVNYVPYFLPSNGDITTSKGISIKNVQQKLNDMLLDFRRNGIPYSNIAVQDIQEMVQIVDLDGAFIPDSKIIRSDSNFFQYTDENIVTSNVDGAKGRNRKKAEILRKLVEIKQVGNVPYSVYFVSCNMDHVLFDCRSLRPNEKTSKAFDFQVKCEKNAELLEESLFKKGVATETSYAASWTDIQEGCRSLNRHTNMNLFFGEGAKNPK